jgi:hypothetical protein
LSDIFEKKLTGMKEIKEIFKQFLLSLSIPFIPVNCSLCGEKSVQRKKVLDFLPNSHKIGFAVQYKG